MPGVTIRHATEAKPAASTHVDVIADNIDAAPEAPPSPAPESDAAKNEGKKKTQPNSSVKR